jgi:hypothetical protein
VTEATLQRARPDEASMLSDLALAAKGFWGYDEAFIESCRAELTFSPDDVARRHFVVAVLGALVVGFYSVDGERQAGPGPVLGDPLMRAGLQGPAIMSGRWSPPAPRGTGCYNWRGQDLRQAHPPNSKALFYSATPTPGHTLTKARG